ncbi:sugar transferase [Caulobacter segnis]
MRGRSRPLADAGPGLWMRKLGLDELPRLWSVLVGHASLVGPRPALFNQVDDLVAAPRGGRRRRAEASASPAGPRSTAATNWPFRTRRALDAEYLRRRSFLFRDPEDPGQHRRAGADRQGR